MGRIELLKISRGIFGASASFLRPMLDNVRAVPVERVQASVTVGKPRVVVADWDRSCFRSKLCINRAIIRYKICRFLCNFDFHSLSALRPLH